MKMIRAAIIYQERWGCVVGGWVMGVVRERERERFLNAKVCIKLKQMKYQAVIYIYAQ